MTTKSILQKLFPGKEIRTAPRQPHDWVVARDVARAMGYHQYWEQTKMVPEDCQELTRVPGQSRELIIISPAAVITIAARRKDHAASLPAIRLIEELLTTPQARVANL